MEVILSFLTGSLYAAGLYLMMRRSLFKLILGLMLMGHAANLLLFTIGGLKRGAPPFIQEGMSRLTGDFADPLPQALILTAIVIGFGLNAFAVMLIRRVHETTGTDDLDEMRHADGPIR